jgi:hypothetical protein
MVKVIFRILASLIPFLVIVALFWININFLSATDGTVVNQVKQLNFIGKAIGRGADTDMQAIYPEGYMFLNCLYGLAWCDVLKNFDQDKMTYSRGLAEVKSTLVKVQSDQARSIFDDELELSHGAFYSGWSNYLLGRKLELTDRDTTGTYQFKTACGRIAKAISIHVYPESYSSMAWPADAVVCVASLALHDRLFGPTYHDVIRTWISKVKKHLDSHGLVPHSARCTGKPIQHARGSSQCLMLSFLKEIDPAFAAEQFALFSQKFIDSKLGLIGIREYPKGIVGFGDVDSGPVILGMGGAASIVGIRTLAIYQHEKRDELKSGIEAFGLPVDGKTERRYFFGMLPMVDAFITWSKCAAINQDSSSHSSMPFMFSATSLIVILACGGMIYWFWR